MSWPPTLTIRPETAEALVEAVRDENIGSWGDHRAQGIARDGVRARCPGLGLLLDEAAAAVARSGAAVLRGVPVDDASLIVVAGALGTVTTDGNGPPPGRLVRDLVTGLPSPEDAAPMTPHTDTVFERDPHPYVALACVRPAPDGGGRSLAVRVQDAVARLAERAPGAAVLLQDDCYPFFKTGRPTVFGPVLDRTGDDLTVRFHDRHLRDGLRLHPRTVDIPHLAALRAFEDVLGRASVVTAFPLGPGDLLLLDNARTLHGRTCLTARSSGRHVRRLKVRAPVPSTSGSDTP